MKYTKKQVQKLLFLQRHNCQIERNKRSILKDGLWYVSCEDVLHAEEPELILDTIYKESSKLTKELQDILTCLMRYTSEGNNKQDAGYLKIIQKDLIKFFKKYKEK